MGFNACLNRSYPQIGSLCQLLKIRSRVRGRNTSEIKHGRSKDKRDLVMEMIDEECTSQKDYGQSLKITAKLCIDLNGFQHPLGYDSLA